jgi:hypothetical protein
MVVGDLDNAREAPELIDPIDQDAVSIDHRPPTRMPTGRTHATAHRPTGTLCGVPVQRGLASNHHRRRHTAPSLTSTTTPTGNGVATDERRRRPERGALHIVSHELLRLD